MNITVRIKNVYGLDMIYPVCDTAIALAELAGQKTFTPNSVKQIKKLGYVFNVQQQPVEV